MLSKKDKRIVETADRMLAQDKTWEEIAATLDMPIGTLYTRIRRLGYKTGKRLVPVHAPSLDNTQVA